MAKEQEKGLEVEEDMRFQHRMWRVQRVGWVVFYGAVVAALLGFFGPGPLSWSEREDGALRVLFDRFNRAHAPTRLEIEIDAGAVAGDELAVLVSREYLAAMKIQGVSPQPDSVAPSGEHLRYTFALDGPGEQITVVFDLQSDDYGSVLGDVILENGDAVPIQQFFYP